jgi:hypothetical protein
MERHYSLVYQNVSVLMLQIFVVINLEHYLTFVLS